MSSCKSRYISIGVSNQVKIKVRDIKSGVAFVMGTIRVKVELMLRVRVVSAAIVCRDGCTLFKSRKTNSSAPSDIPH